MQPFFPSFCRFDKISFLQYLPYFPNMILSLESIREIK